MKNMLEGVLTIYWTTFKQSIRTMWPWIAVVVLLSASSYAAYDNVFPTPKDQMILSSAAQSNPAFNLIFGSADNLLTAEGFTSWRALILGSFLISMMSIFLITRNTKAKEDSGEEELLASSVVGRYAVTTAALGVAVTACLIAAVSIGLPLIALGAEQQFSILLGLAIASVGIFFATVAVLAAQIVSYSRTVTSLSISILGVAYTLRGIADTVDTASWLSLISPMGWAQQVDLSGDGNILPLVALLLASVIIAAVAYVFKSRRDFGQGIIADKPGNARADKLSSINGLALKLQKGSLIGWSVAFVFLGITFGYLIGSMGESFESFAENKGFSSFVGLAQGTDFTFQFAVTALTLLGIIGATYGTQLMFRLYKEEISHRSESLLAGAVERTKLFTSHVQLSILGPVAAVALAGLAIIVVSFFSNVNTGLVNIFQQALVTIPAMLVLIGLAIACLGFNPKLRWVAWLGVGMSFGLTILGPILQLSDNILAISPFWHVPNANSPDLSITTTLVLLGISASLTAVGFIGYKKRDIARV